jgi:hypothetical protein
MLLFYIYVYFIHFLHYNLTSKIHEVSMIYYKVAFEITNCPRLCIERLFAFCIGFRYDVTDKFAMPALFSFLCTFYL